MNVVAPGQGADAPRSPSVFLRLGVMALGTFLDPVEGLLRITIKRVAGDDEEYQGAALGEPADGLAGGAELPGKLGIVAGGGRRGALEKAGEGVVASRGVQEGRGFLRPAEASQRVGHASDGLAIVGLSGVSGLEVLQGRLRFAAGQGQPAAQEGQVGVVFRSRGQQRLGGLVVAAIERDPDPDGSRVGSASRLGSAARVASASLSFWSRRRHSASRDPGGTIGRLGLEEAFEVPARSTGSH